MSAQPIPRWLAIALLLAIATTFGGNHVAARVAFEHGANVTTAVAFRSTGTAVFVFLLLLFSGVSIRTNARTARHSTLIGLLVASQSYCLYSAVAIIPVALALLAFQTFPMMLALLAWATGAERPSRRTLVAMPVAQGYKNNEMVGDALFPKVPVMQRGGKIIAFNREDFKLYPTARAPGATTRRVQYGYSSTPYALEQHALEGLVPIELQEEAMAVPGIDHSRVAIKKTQDIIALRLEKAQADLATNAALYAASNKATLSGTSQWTDAASKPVQAIEDAKEAVRAKVGKRANTVLIGAAVWPKLKDHPNIQDRIKHTGRDIVTVELIKSLFDVQRVVIGDAVYVDDANAQQDVWGKFVVVAYTELSSLADMGTPSYGYTYQLNKYPVVEQPYYERTAKSWVFPVTDEVVPVIAGADAGFLYSAVV